MHRISCKNWLYSLKHIAINENIDWVLKNPELYTSYKLVDHWWELLKSLSNCYDYELKRLSDKTFGVTKYYLDLEIEILDIYPFITLVEVI